MPTEERLILEMLGGGRISVEDAEKLLAAVADRHGNGRAEGPEALSAGDRPDHRREIPPPRFLRIVMTNRGCEEVNVRIPLSLFRAGVHLGTFLPAGACSRLGEVGIDLTRLFGLRGDDLEQALRDLSIDIDAGEKGSVRVFCE